MYCKWCGSEIPEDAKICPHCGEVLRDKEDATPKREGAELEEEIERDLYSFFNKNVGSAYSVNALKNRLNEIVIDYSARAYSFQHLQKILYKMTQKGHLKASYHNNEIHYHFLEAMKEEPASTTYTSETPKKLHDIPLTTQSIFKEPIKPYQSEHSKPQMEGVKCSWCGSEIPEDAQICPNCGESLKKEEEININITNNERDLVSGYKLSVLGATDTIKIRPNTRGMVHLNLEKLQSTPRKRVKIQLSGPPQIDLIVGSRTIRPERGKNVMLFIFLAKELGIFTLTATLTTKAGHQLIFPFKIQVEPISNMEIFYGKNSTNLPSKSTSTVNGKIPALVVTGVIGGILLLVGIFYLYNAIGRYLWTSLPTGTTLAIIGIIILAIVFGIASKGACCTDFFCDDCCCDSC